MSTLHFELLTSLTSMCHLMWMHLEVGEDQFSVPNDLEGLQPQEEKH